jgi:hypothetical protein
MDGRIGPDGFIEARGDGAKCIAELRGHGREVSAGA